MYGLLRLWLGVFLRLFRSRRSLLIENLALRQQLVAFKRKHSRPRLTAADKLFWVFLRGSLLRGTRPRFQAVMASRISPTG
jgi:hypothetical protein